MTNADRAVILKFLRDCEERIEKYANRIPFDSRTGNLVIAWERGVLERFWSEEPTS